MEIARSDMKIACADRPIFEAVKHEDGKIIIEQPAHTTGARLLVGILSVASLILGLKGCYEFAKILMGFGDGTENILVGLILTFGFLVIPAFGLRMAVDSGRKLILNPKKKEAYLTKRYPFKTIEKQFRFYELKPSTLHQDTEHSERWYVRFSLPDRTRFEFSIWSDSFAGDSKMTPELWQKRINAMIRGETLSMPQ